ncbi:MAG: diacylglycerol kinase [Rugosibacter sp.]|nr:diacylglycerol kinase [Rugosibacter sp.]
MKETPFGTGGGIGRLLAAARNSWQGLRLAWRLEAAFRQELLLVTVLLPFALLPSLTAVERVLLIASLLLVLIVELLNSAVEAVVDRVSLEYHELSGRAKDIGSAAVLLTLLLLACTWGLILWPHVSAWLK